MREFLEGLGRVLARRVRIVCYTQFLRAPSLPFGTYIFSDVDRLSGSQSQDVHRRRRLLQDAGAPMLNDPIRTMRRYDLLRWLFENGINEFDCYMMTEHRKPKRFPVFIRRAFDHEGAMSPLLHDQAALDAALDDMRANSEWPDDKIITEYIDVSDADGIFRKHAAFRVGDRFIPRQIMAAKQWVVKKPEIDTAELAAEEAAYVAANPHEEMLMGVFRAARIEYGRIDYTLVDGKPQVFEINCNPSIIGERSTLHVRDPNSLRGATIRPAIQKFIDSMIALDRTERRKNIPVQP